MTTARSFDKVLVANRGEIARRIFRTLREMGMATVAVFADADAGAPHVAEADEAVRLGGPSAGAYLDPEAVIAAARATGAGAIHPGYGFLAENADFAAAVEDAGLVFVGPAPEAIRAMGEKAEAKRLAAEAGVPVLDGFALAGLGPAAVRERADALGYPLLLKAAAGGGGKGMRAVVSAAELDAAVAAAAREAEKAFGDGALIVERLLAAPRHVEVQVLGDADGHVVHLFERDCSLQRRYQKVLEEAPSPAVDEALRARLGEAAVALARAVGYRGAGTVEFLIAPDGSFFFLEMNTRLQVEHPVTEAVTGLDLVRLQIEIARGLPLPFGQDDLAIAGHAIEARLYAEDPDHDFLPATGTVALWSVPALPGVRVDNGVERGVEIGIHYDPLLAKVIAHGRDRDEALRRLHRALSELAVGGLTTNRDFLLAALEDDAFRRGEVDTGFVEKHLPPAARSRPVAPEVLTLHAVAATLHRVAARRRDRPGPTPAGIPAGWRNNRWRPQEEVFEHAGGHVAVRYTATADDRFAIETEGEPTLEARLVPPGLDGDEADDGDSRALVAEIDGVRRRFRIGSDGSGRALAVHGLGAVTELVAVPRFPPRAAAALAGGCAAPMTGMVVEVAVAEGDRVEAGDTLVVLEAMKMEHRLRAQRAGTVESVRAEAGQMVDPDQVLVVIAPEASEGTHATGIKRKRSER